MRRGLQVVLLVGICCVDARAADWSGFRGPSGSCVSEEVNLPTVWSDTTNVLWNTAVPGVGNSSPAVTRALIIAARSQFWPTLS